MNSSKTRGFSLLEMTIAMAVIMIMAAVAAVSLPPLATPWNWSMEAG